MVSDQLLGDERGAVVMGCTFCDQPATGQCSACEAPVCEFHGEVCPDCECEDEGAVDDSPLCGEALEVDEEGEMVVGW